MTSMMVVVSKSVFAKMETSQGAAPGLGDVLRHRRYESRHRSLDQLSSKGALFLVTARPKDRLWLLAIVEKPKADEDGWQGRWNKAPITDITDLIDQLRFSTGKGIKAKAGKLGMSLQTPRVLTDDDVALLRDAVGGTKSSAKKKKTAKKKTAKKKTAKKSTKQSSVKGDLSSVAESRADLAIRVPDARCVATRSAWTRASAAQRKALVKAIETEAEIDLRFVKMEKHAIPIAVFEHRSTKIRFCLVPGGQYMRGFSKREEKLVRDAAKANQGIGNHYEEYGVLLGDLGNMRPCKKVVVGAFLIAQKSQSYDVTEVAATLRELPFRLPSEAEHEYAQRGVAESELTWNGHEIPNEKWFEKSRKKKNDFGLEQMGYMPEVCGDMYGADHARAPKTGIRSGKGTRVARGGAAMLYPWQGCGEWHMLLNAFRAPADIWEFEIAMRPAIGIR